MSFWQFPCFFFFYFYLEVRVRATLRGRGTGVRSGGCREQPVFLGAYWNRHDREKLQVTRTSSSSLPSSTAALKGSSSPIILRSINVFLCTPSNFPRTFWNVMCSPPRLSVNTTRWNGNGRIRVSSCSKWFAENPPGGHGLVGQFESCLIWELLKLGELNRGM